MRGKTKKRIVLTVIIILLFISITIFVYWAGLLTPKTNAFSPHYLMHKGIESKIYLASTTSAYAIANQTYLSSDGQIVAKGSQLFTISLMLRNDYSSDNPPPSLNTPITPIDGTAYICLNITLLSKNEVINTINVTPSDFSTLSSDQIGLVLASGQTDTINIYLATDNKAVSDFIVNLVFVGDSILS